MICKIAELVTRIPEAGDLPVRCRAYRSDDPGKPDIVIRAEQFDCSRWVRLSENDSIYVESGLQFYRQLLAHEGMMLHASAIAVDGRAYLFAGASGVGKSTHTRLWKQIFGEAAQVINDDKPPLRRVDGTWYAYGAPWCGKDGINQNRKVRLAGICFLKQASQNRIRRLSSGEAVRLVLLQTMKKFAREEPLELLLSHVDRLVREIPIYELENRPEPEAAHLSYETMLRGAQEAQL